MAPLRRSLTTELLAACRGLDRRPRPPWAGTAAALLRPSHTRQRVAGRRAHPLHPAAALARRGRPCSPLRRLSSWIGSPRSFPRRADTATAMNGAFAPNAATPPCHRPGRPVHPTAHRVAPAPRPSGRRRTAPRHPPAATLPPCLPPVGGAAGEDLRVPSAHLPALCRSDAPDRLYITEPATSEPILTHLELPATPPPLAPARGPPLWEAELDQTPAWDLAGPQADPGFEFDQTPAWDPAGPQADPGFEFDQTVTW